MSALRSLSRSPLVAATICAFAALAALAGCSVAEPDEGAKRPARCDMGALACDCYRNGSCDEGLVCAEGRCVASNEASVDAGPDVSSDTGDVSEPTEPTDPGELTVGNVRITPAPAYNDSVLRCEADVAGPGPEAPELGFVWQAAATGAELGQEAELDLRGKDLAPGSLVTCRAVAGWSGARAEGEASVTLENRSPQVDAVTVTPAEAEVGTQVTCAADVSDPDGSAGLDVSYAWSTGAEGPTYVLAASDAVGSEVTCTATVRDLGGATSLQSAAVTVRNSAPVVNAVRVSPAEARVGDWLTCEVAATDANLSELVYTYTWTNGATDFTYQVRPEDRSLERLGCAVVVSDPDGGSAVLESENEAILRNTPPVVTAVTVSPSEARVGETVTCTAFATDADGDTPSLGYAWSNGLTGATQVLTSASTDPGMVLRCTATARDSEGATGSLVSAQGAEVLNSAPTAPVVSLTPATARGGDDLTCQVTTASTDADEDTVRYRYAWLKDGAVHSEEETTALSSRVEGVNVSAGETWVCSVTALDGRVGESAVAMVEVTVGERIPEGFVRIPAGSFVQGPDGGVSRTVTISRPFYLQATEVTQGQWRTLMGNNPSWFSSCGDDCPVERVNWYEALRYMNAASSRDGLTSCYALSGCTGVVGSGCGTSNGGTSCANNYVCTGATFSGLSCSGYRLPTEAEWEYAARGGTTGQTYGGNLPGTDCPSSLPVLGGIVWYGCNSSSSTQRVGQKTANAYGLHDMLGNVDEWTWDRYASYTSASVTDPLGPNTGSYRVVRGGSWYADAGGIVVSRRSYYSSPGYRFRDLGLRPSRSVP